MMIVFKVLPVAAVAFAIGLIIAPFIAIAIPFAIAYEAVDELLRR